MEREQLQDAIGQVDDSLTAETDRILRKGVRKLPVWTRLVARRRQFVWLRWCFVLG